MGHCSGGCNRFTGEPMFLSDSRTARKALKSEKVEKIVMAAKEVHAEMKEEMGDKAFFLTGAEFKLLRFLVVCHWDSADEQGWVNFTNERIRRHINQEDIDTFEKFEEKGILEDCGTGLYPSVRFTLLGWSVIAQVSAFVQESNFGWRRFKNPSTIVFDKVEMKVKDWV